MKLDINNYTEILYVSTEGSDTIGSGSEDSPFETIEYAISKVSTDNPLIVIGSGTFTITSISSLSISGKTSNIIGKGKKTIIVCSQTGVNYTSETSTKLNVYSCLFKASDSFGGDQRSLMYSYYSGTQEVHYYNVFFSVSDNGTYPTSGLMWHTNNSRVFTNKYYHNCSFYGKPNNGIAQYENCSTNQTNFSESIINDTADSSYIIDCIKSVAYDNNKYIENGNNETYGVYSGEFSWMNILNLILYNNKYYSIKKENYNTITQTYNEITDLAQDNYETYGFEIDDLFKELTINSETFKPIDKFNNFQLVTNKKAIKKILGIKSNKEMVVGKQSFSTAFARNIDCFKLDDGATDIKVAFSIDDGTTWKTWNATSSAFKDMSITIPVDKVYADFDSTDLNNWNTARDTIYTDGIDIATLSTLDFNTLDMPKIRFAYVLSATDTETMGKMKQLIWQFDAVGTMELCSPSDVRVQINSTGVKLISNIDSDMLKVNVTYEGVKGSTSASLEIDRTTDDIQSDIDGIFI